MRRAVEVLSSNVMDWIKNFLVRVGLGGEGKGGGGQCEWEVPN